jgi:hypothetical protein
MRTSPNAFRTVRTDEKHAEGQDSMSDSDGWIEVTTLSTGIEAEIAAAVLRAEDIPAMVRSHDTIGLFGASFQGANLRGFGVLVPAHRLEDALTSIRSRAPLTDDVLPDESND